MLAAAADKRVSKSSGVFNFLFSTLLFIQTNKKKSKTLSVEIQTALYG
jgi:hypothetical protein